MNSILATRHSPGDLLDPRELVQDLGLELLDALSDGVVGLVTEGHVLGPEIAHALYERAEVIGRLGRLCGRKRPHV